jgi:ABC-type nitrate/sulfonate/bicarbonate transport system substrate-binding protein
LLPWTTIAYRKKDPSEGQAILTLRISRCLRAGLAVLALMAVASPSQGQQADKIVLHEGYPSRVASFWPNYVAAAVGLYAKQGLEVQDVVVDPNLTTSMLIGGSVEVSHADTTQLMLALQKGANLVAVGLQTDRNPYSLMAPAAIKTVADLKGKRIGAAGEIDVYTYVIKQILRKAKLDPDKDVEFVYGGGQNQRLSAIIGGAIQAGLFSPPSDARLKDQGFHVLAFAPDVAPNLALSVTTVRRDWAEQHSDILRKLLRAQYEAVQWLNNPANKAQALTILETTINARPADAEAAYDYYIGKHIWADACVHRPGLLGVVNIMHETGQLTTLTPSDVPKIADPEWCAK